MLLDENSAVDSRKECTTVVLAFPVRVPLQCTLTVYTSGGRESRKKKKNTKNKNTNNNNKKKSVPGKKKMAPCRVTRSKLASIYRDVQCDFTCSLRAGESNIK